MAASVRTSALLRILGSFQPEVYRSGCLFERGREVVAIQPKNRPASRYRTLLPEFSSLLPVGKTSLPQARRLPAWRLRWRFIFCFRSEERRVGKECRSL